MVSLEQKIKEYVSSVEIPDRVKPEEIRRLLEDNGDMTAGVFLRKLKELKISGSDFLELLGNSKIGNMEFRRIEENPHLKFDELLQILDNSVLSGDDYRMIIAVATQRKELAEQRKRREEETLRRMTEELSAKKNVHKEEETGTRQEDTADISENTSETDAQEAPDSEKLSAAEALILRMQKEIDSEENVETVENTSNYTDGNTDLPESERKTLRKLLPQKPKKIMRKRKVLLRRKKAPRPITPTATAKALLWSSAYRHRLSQKLILQARKRKILTA